MSFSSAISLCVSFPACTVAQHLFFWIFEYVDSLTFICNCIPSLSVVLSVIVQRTYTPARGWSTVVNMHNKSGTLNVNKTWQP